VIVVSQYPIIAVFYYTFYLPYSSTIKHGQELRGSVTHHRWH